MYFQYRTCIHWSEEIRHPIVLCKSPFYHCISLLIWKKNKLRVVYCICCLDYFEQAHWPVVGALSPEEQEHAFPHLQLSLKANDVMSRNYWLKIIIISIDLRACSAGTTLGCGTTLAGFSSASALILLTLASRSTAWRISHFDNQKREKSERKK